MSNSGFTSSSGRDCAPRLSTAEDEAISFERKPNPFQIYLLGWPALLMVWSSAIAMLYAISTNFFAPLARDHNAHTTELHPVWYMALLPAVSVPVGFFFVYGAWLGWKFFQRN